VVWCSGSPKTGSQGTRTSGEGNNHIVVSQVDMESTPEGQAPQSPKTNSLHPLCYESFYLKGIFFNGFNHIFEEDL